MADAKTTASGPPRVLSPHLTVYRWPITMAMSIAHRVTGVGLYFGTALLAWWLIAAASGPNAYGSFQAAAGSWIGRLVLLGYTWALLHHMLGGIRHLIWDLGYWLEPGKRDQIARATIYGSAALTVLVWIVAYLISGSLR
jgi:succinate dehydrogenase / fumarate reductase cytochrome b subunit